GAAHELERAQEAFVRRLREDRVAGFLGVLRSELEQRGGVGLVVLLLLLLEAGLDERLRRLPLAPLPDRIVVVAQQAGEAAQAAGFGDQLDRPLEAPERLAAPAPLVVPRARLVVLVE